ncbi:MAG: hypothetical protein H7836_09340 [Magnetococcus sp. YQC-3]
MPNVARKTTLHQTRHTICRLPGLPDINNVWIIAHTDLDGMDWLKTMAWYIKIDNRTGLCITPGRPSGQTDDTPAV